MTSEMASKWTQKQFSHSFLALSDITFNVISYNKYVWPSHNIVLFPGSRILQSLAPRAEQRETETR